MDADGRFIEQTFMFGLKGYGNVHFDKEIDKIGEIAG